MKFLKIFMPALVFSSLFFTACDKDDSTDDDLQGTARVEITDGPSDDTNIRAVMVTVADVKVDGQSIEGFSKTTFDLSSYQNGNTKMLGDLNLDAGSYNNLTLVLDYEKDENGNSPGTYVEEMDGTKNTLMSTTTAINLSNDFDIMSDQTTDLVIDFDLRKSIRRTSDGNGYEFVSSADLQSAVRFVVKDEAGMVSGNVDNMGGATERVMVYAYKKGKFNRSKETNVQNGLAFTGAVTSTMADENGNYELHFLEEGDYELHFARYEDNDNDGKFELEGTLLLDILSSINLENISVGANANVTVNVTITGILPI
jgi:hypothetical protein